MSAPKFYRFRSEWELDAPRSRVFEVLRKGASYERWWPQVKRSARLSDGSYYNHTVMMRAGERGLKRYLQVSGPDSPH
jgi:hypothetical protein